jgi:hypothetical protein
MGAGTSIFLIAVGAILRFAVNVSAKSFNIKTVGLILLIVGIVGLILSLFFWRSWGGFGGYGGRSRRVARGRDGTYVEERERY